MPSRTPRWTVSRVASNRSRRKGRAVSGNCPLEAFVAVADLMGREPARDLFPLMDAADDLVRPLQDREVGGPRDPQPGLCEVGRRGMVGGQEDVITDIALDLLARAQTSS